MDKVVVEVQALYKCSERDAQHEEQLQADGGVTPEDLLRCVCQCLCGLFWR